MANKFAWDIVGGTDTAQTKSITGATRANPCVITVGAGHGFVAGQRFIPSGVGGMTQLNGQHYIVGNVLSSTTFELKDVNGNAVNSSAYGVYTSGGTISYWYKPIQSITKANPAVVTSEAHGYTNGTVLFFKADGMTELDELVGTVANATANTYEISGVDSSAFGTFTDGYAHRPFLNYNTIETSLPSPFYTSADTVYAKQTWKDDASVMVGSGSIVFARGNVDVTTSVSLVGVITAGDFIGLSTAVGTGCASDPTVTRPETFYKVLSVVAAKITLTTPFDGVNSTVSSVKRLRSGTEIRDTGSAASNAVTASRAGTIVSGGYEFVSGQKISRTGETWIQPVTKNADYRCLQNNAVSSDWSYFGFVNGYRGVTVNGNGINMSRNYIYATNYYGIDVASTLTNVTITNNIVSAVVSGYAGIYNLGTILNSCVASYNYVFGVATGTINGILLGAYSYAYRNQVSFCARGIISGQNLSGAIMRENKVYGCMNGYFRSIDTQVIGCSAENCTYGQTNYQPTKGGKVVNCTFTTCTYGGYLSQSIGLVFEGNSYVSCGRDLGGDSYSTNLKISGHYSTTPTTYAFDVSATTGLEISDFTIDSPSIAKAFSAIHIQDGLQTPAYTITASPQFADGQYFLDGQFTKDTADTYAGAPWSYKFTILGTSTYLVRDINVFPIAVRSGHGGTLTYRLKRNASWAGTLTPKFYLNGILIETETAITTGDISDSSYTEFTATVANGPITTDGVLVLAFNYNATANALNLHFTSWIES